MKLAAIEEGVRPGVTASESAELRDLRKRNRLLEQEILVFDSREALAAAAPYVYGADMTRIGSTGRPIE